MALSAVFLAHIGETSSQFRHLPDLEVRLAAVWEAGRAAWPDLDLPADELVRHLAERLAASKAGVDALAAVEASDLYLACACSRGDERAVSHFECTFMPQVVAHLGRSERFGAFADEARQRVRARLLVAEPGERPRIAGYNGSGPLGAWVCVVAARIAVDMQRAEKPHDVLDHAGRHLASLGADPEIGYLKTRYGKELEEAFRAALATLSPREANVLGLYFVQEATAEAIARIYKVSQRTVQRWVADMRQRVMKETRRVLSERLQISSAEFDSLMALAQSQVDVSIHRLLP